MKLNLKKNLTMIQKGAAKRKPEIFILFGIAGMVGAAIWAVKETPKAEKRIEARKEELGVDELPKKELVKTVLPCYAPPVTLGILSTGCVIFADRIHVKRNAALMGAYALSEKTLKEYKDKVVEVIGEKKEKSIRDEIAKDRMEKDPVTNVTETLPGTKTLCYDMVTERYFERDIETVKRAVELVNRRLRNEMYVSINEFYSEMDLKGSPTCEHLGWCVDKGYLDPLYSSKLASDGRPCLVINYDFYLLDEYGRLY